MLGLGAVALHGMTLVLDSTIQIAPTALLVPGLAPYRPLWTAFGVLAAELMMLVILSFPLRKRIGMRAGGACTGRPTPSSRLATAPRPRGRHGLPAPWAFALYLGAVGAVVVRDRLARARPVPSEPKPQGGQRVPDPDRPVAV